MGAQLRRRRGASARCARHPALRLALARALAEDPGQRPSAVDFAPALRGGEADEPPPSGPPPPFRELFPLTERDRGRLHGRDADVLRLARRLDVRRTVVFTAPSGTGKTSLLRAGLVPYLDAAGTSHIYLACEPGARAALLRAHPAATSLEAAFAAWEARDRRLVVILDQLESVLALDGEGQPLLVELIELVRSSSLDVSIVLGVREDFVARLLAAATALADGVPQVRLGPLDREAARAALVEPLAEHGIVIEPALLETLLDDLVGAGRELGTDFGWGAREAIYPPHLQLAGVTLFDAVVGRETVVTLDHYRRLGGFDSIVAEYLDRSLGGLSSDDREVARDLFLTLVASAQTRAVRGEADLLETLGARHGDDKVRRVLARLEAHRLIARRAGSDGVATWSLVHDTLVPRIEAWLSVHDLDCRRAAEVVRFHLRQSQPDQPATLNAGELRAVTGSPDCSTSWRSNGSAGRTPR